MSLPVWAAKTDTMSGRLLDRHQGAEGLRHCSERIISTGQPAPWAMVKSSTLVPYSAHLARGDGGTCPLLRICSSDDPAGR